MYSFSQVLRRAALVNGDGVATRYQGRNTTWAQTSARVPQLAGALRTLGLDSGDRVAILGVNSDEYFQWLFAIPWAGGVFVPVNTRLAPEEIVYCLNQSGSRVLIVDDTYSGLVAQIRGEVGSIEHVIHISDRAAAPGCVLLRDLLARSAPVPDAGRGGDDLASICFTGGTSGRSKGVMLTHDHLIVSTLQWAFEIGVGRDDVILVVAPMFHLAGAINAFAAAVLAASACIMSRFDPRLMLQTMASERVTKAAWVPTMLNAILSHPDFASFDLSSLRRITYGGSPISETLLRRALEALPHVQLFQVYGQTEGGPIISVLKPVDHQTSGPTAGRLNSAGQMIVGTEIRIVDADDQPVGHGVAGEICVRGLTVAHGYWNLPEETRQAQRGGWLHTGDAGYLDADGFLYIVDRVKDMIITGGENVYPQEVENVLCAHPAVFECAVFGIPDERWGERIHAVVRLREGCSVERDELIAHCRQHLAPYKCIRSVDFRTEPFPLSGISKILKRELRAPYWQARQRQV